MNREIKGREKMYRRKMEGSTDKHKEIIKYLKDEIYVKRMGKDGLHPPLGVKHCDKSIAVALIVPLLVP